MKRIGILTFHRSINYGAFMQSYSLAQQLIKRYGNIVEIIDFEKASKHDAYNSKPGLFQALVYGKDDRVMRNRFFADLSLLPLSRQSLITNNYEEVLRYINGKYDIVVVGSDAVWAYNKGLGLHNPYWLFGDALQCEKLSYAASAYSLDQSKMSEDDRQYIGSCLKSFSYIGVRDFETENLVKKCLPGAIIHRNCDPTVLLDKPNPTITAQVLEKQHLNPNKKLVTIMMRCYEPLVYEVMNKLGRKDYQYVYLYSRMKARERFFPLTPRYLYNLSPFEWYHLYGAVYFNMTAFFHGTLLALKSAVPTITFDTSSIKGDYKSKIHQIMDDIGLLEYYNSYRDGISKNLILEQVAHILRQHDAISESIDAVMTSEAEKAKSFFETMDKLV